MLYLGAIPSIDPFTLTNPGEHKEKFNEEFSI
jgi:hypothetical protein